MDIVSWTPENAALKEYVHAMHVISEYSSPQFSKFNIVYDTVLFQYTLKKGLKVFGEAGAEAMSKELQQINGCNVLEPKFFTKLTQEQQVWALAYHVPEEET